MIIQFHRAKDTESTPGDLCSAHEMRYRQLYRRFSLLLPIISSSTRSKFYFLRWFMEFIISTRITRASHRRTQFARSGLSTYVKPTHFCCIVFPCFFVCVSILRTFLISLLVAVSSTYSMLLIITILARRPVLSSASFLNF